MLLTGPDILFRELAQFAYNAECQLVITLPRVAARARSEELRTLIEEHRTETVAHVRRLEQIGVALGFACGGKISSGMQGILKEGDELAGYGGAETLVDTSVVAASRRVEHFEIASYTSLLELAVHLKAGAVVELLNKTLREESAADEKLAAICSRMNAPTASAPFLVS